MVTELDLQQIANQLVSVDNKALKSEAITNITRSGLTFTATRASGGTFTFNQQDNNTTYGVATTSANGLMSSTDKTNLENTKKIVNFTWLASGIYYCKTGGICIVQIENVNASSSVLATLPSGYRPSRTAYGIAASEAGQSAYIGYIKVYTNGQVQVVGIPSGKMTGQTSFYC